MVAFGCGVARPLHVTCGRLVSGVADLMTRFKLQAVLPVVAAFHRAGVSLVGQRAASTITPSQVRPRRSTVRRTFGPRQRSRRQGRERRRCKARADLMTRFKPQAAPPVVAAFHRAGVSLVGQRAASSSTTGQVRPRRSSPRRTPGPRLRSRRRGRDRHRRAARADRPCRRRLRVEAGIDLACHRERAAPSC